jgi:hypothetical protein
MSGDVAGVVHDVAQPENTCVGYAEQEAGELRAGEKEAAKTDLLGHPGVYGAEASRHHDKVLAGEHGAQFEALASRFIGPFAAHALLRLWSWIASSTERNT